MSSFTKDAIKMTFVSLLDQKPLNQITVKMVVEECGINRNSFYYHFQDIPALLEEIIMDHLEQFVRKYPTIDDMLCNFWLRIFLQFFEEFFHNLIPFCLYVYI